MYDFGARLYDPLTQQWVSRDKKLQFATPYAYAGNYFNPVNFFDPDGNCMCEINYKPSGKNHFKELNSELIYAASWGARPEATTGEKVLGFGFYLAAAYSPESNKEATITVLTMGAGYTIAKGASNLTKKIFNNVDEIPIKRFEANDLVLGLDMPRLNKWAKAEGGKTYGKFELPRGSFSTQIKSAMTQAKTLRFNLDGVDVTKASGKLNDFGEPINGYTNFELYLIKTNKEFHDKTKFYLDGKEVSSPFE